MRLAPKETALTLLSVARSTSLTAVSIGDLTLMLAEGNLLGAEVPRDGLLSFLLRAHLLDPPKAREFRDTEDDKNLEALVELLGESTVARYRRAAWIDRLTSALATEQIPKSDSLRPVTSVLRGEPFVPLLLEALTRLASTRDAGVVGSHPDFFLRWLDSEHAQEIDIARSWLGFQTSRAEPLSRCFVRHPGAPPRIAALCRAGFVELTETAEDTDRVSVRAPSKPSLLPPQGPYRGFQPGASLPPINSFEEPDFPELPAASRPPLLDPLFELEERATNLDRLNAPGPDRCEAWSAVGRGWLYGHGALDEACRAFREAAAADPTDTSALLQSARLCEATGLRELAREYAEGAAAVTSAQLQGEACRLAARFALRDGDPEAAADHLRNQVEVDADAAYVWAALARATGAADLVERADTISGAQTAARLSPHRFVEYPEARIADIAREAEMNQEERHALRLEAAENAELLGRADLSFHLLLRTFIDAPSLSVIHEALLSDAKAAGLPAMRAVIAERIASRDTSPSYWFLRAAESFELLPEGRNWAYELLCRALEADPTSEPALSALTVFADQQHDATLLADALERAALRASESQSVALLERLAILAEGRLASVHRAAWAWRRVAEITSRPDAEQNAERLEAKARIRSSLLDLAEDALTDGTTPRATAVRRLAAMLRDHPAERERAAALYAEYLRSAPDDRSAAQSLRRIQAILSHPHKRIDMLREALVRTPRDTPMFLRICDELAGLCALEGDWERTFEAAERWITIAPKQPIAVARLELAASMLKDPEKIRRARRFRLALPPALPHAVWWVQEARSLSNTTERLEALEAALRIDIRCVPAARDAALLSHGTLDERWARCERALAICPNDPTLLARAATLAETQDPAMAPVLAARLEAIATPSEPDPKERFIKACEFGDVESAEVSLDVWIAASIKVSGREIAGALSKLAEKNQQAAVRLLARTTDQTSDPRFLSVAQEFSKSAISERILHERQLIWDGAASSHLHALARLAQAEKDAPREARDLVRALAENPADESALRRLTQIYATHGESARLRAAVELFQHAASIPEGMRIRTGMWLASLKLQSVSSEEVTEGLEVLRKTAENPAYTERVASVLSRTGYPTEAVAILTTRFEEERESNSGQAVRRARQALHIASEVSELSSAVRRGALNIAKAALKSGLSDADLMLAFERFSLDCEAQEDALEVYDAIERNSMGRHARCAAMYRRARWLESYGAYPDALLSYKRAFIQDPSEGAVLSALERVGRRMGQLDPLAEALSKLSEKETHYEQKLRYELKLVALLAEDLHRKEDAYERLVEVWELYQRDELHAELIALTSKLDESTRKKALLRIAKALEERASDAWNPDEQLRVYGKLAHHHALLRQDPNAAVATLKTLLQLYREETAEDGQGPPSSLISSAFASTGAALRELAPEYAAAIATEALVHDPESPAAMSLLSAIDATPAEIIWHDETQKNTARDTSDATLDTAKDETDRDSPDTQTLAEASSTETSHDDHTPVPVNAPEEFIATAAIDEPQGRAPEGREVNPRVSKPVWDEVTTPGDEALFERTLAATDGETGSFDTPTVASKTPHKTEQSNVANQLDESGNTSNEDHTIAHPPNEEPDSAQLVSTQEAAPSPAQQTAEAQVSSKPPPAGEDSETRRLRTTDAYALGKPDPTEVESVDTKSPGQATNADAPTRRSIATFSPPREEGQAPRRRRRTSGYPVLQPASNENPSAMSEPPPVGEPVVDTRESKEKQDATTLSDHSSTGQSSGTRLSAWVQATVQTGLPASAGVMEVKSEGSGEMGETPSHAELVAMAKELLTVPGGQAEALNLLLVCFRARPWRVDLLSSIRHTAASTGSSGAHNAAAELGGALGLWSATKPPPFTAALRPTPNLPVFEALAIVWEHALASLRDVRDSALIERSTAPTFDSSELATHRSPMRFRSTNEFAGTRVYETNPPTVLVGSLEESEAAFNLGQAAALAQPACVLLSGPRELSERRLKAIIAAFGPPSGDRPSPKTAVLMGELWRVIPARTQTRLRELLTKPPESVDVVLAELEAWSACAGYLADGDLERSLRSVGIDLQNYVHSMKHNSRAKAIVRFAFSDEVLLRRSDNARKAKP